MYSFVVIRHAFVLTLGGFFPFILTFPFIKLSIRLAGTIPDNTSRFDETLCSGVDVHALFTSWEVSPIKDVVLLTSLEVSPIKDVVEVWFGFDDGGSGGFDDVGGSGGFDDVSGGGGFDDVGGGGGGFDDVGGGGGFDEWPDIRLVSIALLSRGNMPHFLKPIFISATVIDS